MRRTITGAIFWPTLYIKMSLSVGIRWYVVY